MWYLPFSFIFLISINNASPIIQPTTCLTLANHFNGADEKTALDLISHISIALSSKPALSGPATTTIELLKLTGPQLLSVVPDDTSKTFFKVEIEVSMNLNDGVHAKIKKILVSEGAIHLYQKTTSQSKSPLLANETPINPVLINAWIEILPRVYEALELEKESKRSLVTPQPSAHEFKLNPWGWKEMAMEWQRLWDEKSVSLLDTAYDLALTKQYWPFVSLSRRKGALPIIVKRFGLAFYKKISDEITFLSPSATVSYLEDFIHDAEELEQKRPTARDLLKAGIYGKVIVDHFGKWAAVLKVLQELQEMPFVNQQTLRSLTIRAKKQYFQIRMLLLSNDTTLPVFN